jgi:hypothetical protein
MVSAGALVDILKTIDLLEAEGEARYTDLRERLVATGRWALDLFLGYSWNPHTQTFAEYLDPITRTPYRNERGHVLCDPGHTAEGVGFFAEFLRWLPEEDQTSFRFGRDNSLPILIDILRFVDRHGYSGRGVMYKHIDTLTLKGVPDVVRDNESFTTAPWWNVRETAAAASKLYALTGEAELWQIYARAFNAAYENYTNANIGGLFLQTLDAETLAPLPIAPATGNLDPMHSPRAREREIEALESL